jgi:hypothetical protein
VRKSTQNAVREALRKAEDGMTAVQLEGVTGNPYRSIIGSLKCMPDAYIDRWETKGKKKYVSAVWCVVIPPPNCPKPNE